MIDFLFPHYCILCGKESREVLCLQCWKKLKRSYFILDQHKERCKKCFHLLHNGKCFFCESRHLYFDQLFALYEYNSFTKNILLDWKYHNNEKVYRIFVKDILKLINQINPERLGFISSSKFGKDYRSYDVLESLVNTLHKKTMIPYNKDIIKIKKNKQSKGKQNERFFNVLFSFGLTKKFKLINKYLIIEDTITTGATINEAARLLKEMGVEKVYIISIFLEDVEEDSLWNRSLEKKKMI